MAKFIVKKITENRIKAGEKLINVDDLEDGQGSHLLSEGSRIDLVDQEGNFLAKLLVGRQNKGLGWIFTNQRDHKFSQAWIQDLLNHAIDERFSSFDLQETNAFRLFNGEGDGLGGVTIDYYAGYLQINWYSKGVYGYREWFMEGLVNSEIEFEGIYETLRFDFYDDQDPIQLRWGNPAPQPLIIKENGLNFAIYLGQEWMTGLFLDQREVRKFILEQGQGESLLNLFSYTGAFSLVGAKSGILKTVSVDVANRSLERTKEQFQINQVDLSSDNHEIRVMDVFDYIKYAHRHDIRFDWVICDPPSYARTKKFVFSAEKDYLSLAEDLFTMTKPGGMTIISTNHSGYPASKFRQDMVEVGRNHPGQFQLIQSFGLPLDFPTSLDESSQYLKVLVFYRSI